MSNNPGALAAISAGVLFGASTPLAKSLIHGIDPWMLAGLLYLGAGVGLGTYGALRYFLRAPRADHTSLRGADRCWLAAAISAGGVVGPVLMMLSVNGGLVWGDAAGAAAVAGACLAWALDNNFTRKVALNDVTQIAMLKGLVAGAVNVAIAVALGRSLPSAAATLAAGAVGLGGYGLSLVLFVIALRFLGTARTGAYFSIAPFVGALIAVAFYGEPVTIQLLCAAGLMMAGLWLHLTERHEHEHTHACLTHSHLHVHDVHHQHGHTGQAGVEPHVHLHTHAPLSHAHPHYPDEHHRHEH
jgi:drug/metabolite transporter (DMT)-like permease